MLSASMVVLLVMVVLWRRNEAAMWVHDNWGIDAVLTRHIPAWQIPSYKRLLGKSGVGILRERNVGSVGGKLEKPGFWQHDARMKFRALKAQGYRIDAFTTLPFKTEPQQAGNQLSEDLCRIYRQGLFLGREFAGLVDAWEMVGEPDLGYCTDLPDRVVAYQKALYLGIKAGSRERGTGSPIVLMGALGSPPGPWLDRFAANSGLDYTDAYNFHFYGHAKDMTGVIEAHRAAARHLSEPIRQAQGTTAAPLPLWITEAGIAAVSKDDFANPERRQLQADFTISTAKQALAAEDVAVFMPFILVHDKDPFAMTLSPWKTFPAWDAYAKFTRENPWPKRPLAREAKEVNPVVMQWLPDNTTCVPHKVSGTYRFRGGQPIKGELRVYNFSNHTVMGKVKADTLRFTAIQYRGVNPLLQSISVPAMGMVSIPLEFSRTGAGYFRETWSAAFVQEASDSQASGLKSQVSFGLEARPRWPSSAGENCQPDAAHNGR